MSDQERLAGYIEVWWQAILDFTEVLEQVPEERWSTPTDLPGWDVRAVAAHVAHLETVLATGEEEHADIGEPAHVTGMMGQYTEIGPVNRRTHTPDELIREIRESAGARHAALLADPPTDGHAKPERVFAGVPWSWETLLRNRPLDVWMHEQDIRRAVDLPGGLDTGAARHTAEYLAESVGYVVAKKVGAPSGTTVVLDLAGSEPFAFSVSDLGRGERLPAPPPDPTVTLRTDRETFLLLAGGRREVAPDAVVVEGEPDLGRRIVERLATTP